MKGRMEGDDPSSAGVVGAWVEEMESKCSSSKGTQLWGSASTPSRNMSDTKLSWRSALQD